ncbi:floral homeotic protein DEFICIENS-like [Neltuma alba]|uniref:floral homeotic protein DEFICIENS-like n=1 Tax=Neltuma alba TaxID=207710 RepID=UPI0010A2DA12|nr:floral homeotic protein DEFICIENS-like [Prosopis alba]XP_028807246.1 floral homeotic protein DEFICIENS-like [Prosopis alba]XP_028807247.1 floral homeotic protein DEFICIENS-like [Prosopis alba]
MGRGKIEIKLIENATNRQVTYSKRRNGIFKKAHELSVLCDAKVSLIMFSKNNKMHEYTTPGLTTKNIIDQYQRTLGNIDLWSAQYERMLENMKKLKETNNKLRRQIRQRMGEDLNDLDFQQLRSLEEDMVSASGIIRERKLHVIKTRTSTSKKRVKSMKQMNENLLLELEKCVIHSQYLVPEEGDQESSAVTVATGVSNFHGLCHQQHPTHMNLHHNGMGLRSDDLRLA